MSGPVALITGGSGYFGCLLRDRLLADGFRVRIFDLTDSDCRPPEVDLFVGDIRDIAAVRAACAGTEVVYHCVAQVPLARDRHQFRTVNVDGTARLLEACAANGVRKVVHLSSSAVYGVPRQNPVDESTAPDPREDYGRAKLEAENVVRQFTSAGRLDVTIVRPRTILGHGRLGIFQILFEWVSEGRNIPVLGSGDNVYQFVHADDLADACLRAAARPGPTAYNIGAARFGTMRETLEALCAHARTGSRVVSFPRRLARSGMRLSSALGLSPLGPYHWLMYGESLWFDTARARRELSWSPRWSNLEMICQSYDWYLDHAEEVRAARGRSPHRSAVRQGILSLLKRFA